MSAHRALARSLTENGHHTMFGLIGDGNLFFADSYSRGFGGTYVGVTHEANAICGALGYAQRADAMGVATVTHGPGLTNTLTPLVEATRGRVRLLVIVGDTPVADAGHMQDIVQRDVIAPTGAGFVQVRTPESALDDLARAVRQTNVERRPVILNVPSEFMWSPITYETTDLNPLVPTPYLPSSDELETAAGILASASRPLVLAGRGAIGDEARASLLRLARRLGAPVATTFQARDLFAGEPDNIGVFGTLATPAALQAIVESDCILAFGASLNGRTTVNGSLINRTRLVHCDIDPASLTAGTEADARLLGDAAMVADGLVELIDQAEIQPTKFADRVVLQLKEVPIKFEDRSGAETVDVRTALDYIDNTLEVDRSLVIDSGRSALAAWERVSLAHPRKTIYASNFGAIGFGVGCALGTSFASDEVTLLVVGDGSLMLGGLAELHTAVRYRRDMVVVILNDLSFGSEHVQFRKRDMDAEISMFRWPNFDNLAVAIGAQGARVTDLQSLDELGDIIRKRDRTRPLIIDLLIDVDLVSELYSDLASG